MGAANLCNTYFDFRNGVDKETADDRALVDGTVSQDGVLRLSLALFGLAGVMLARFTYIVGAHYMYLALPGMLLALFYTADPFSLKSRGLGDVVIFLCFGPLLMLAVHLSIVSAAVSTYSASLVVALSVPVGLLTEAILHANNTRDIDADKAAKVFTVAQALGAVGCYKMFLALIGGAYLSTAVLCFAFGWRPLLVLCNLPWTVYICRLFAAGVLSELPQRTAQHNLMFGVILTGAIAPPMFFARFLLGCLFYLGGVNNIIMWNYVIHLVQERLELFFPVSRAVTCGALGAAVVIQLVGSLFFILGYHERLAAQALLLWLIPITFTVHNLWTIEGEEYGSGGGGSSHFTQISKRTVPNFATEFDNEFVHFFKNVGMIGGLVIFLEMGGGLKHV